MGETSPTCTGMCPHCGAIVGVWGSLTVEHLDEHGAVCPGSVQNARCAESDRRPLWNGQPNPHLAPVEVPSLRHDIATLLDAHLLDTDRIETGVLPCLCGEWVGDSIDHFRLHQADVALGAVADTAVDRFRQVLAAHGRVSLDDLDQIVDDLIQAVTA